VFCVLFGRLRECVWAEVAKYATEVENVIGTTTKLIAALHQFYGITNPKVKVMKPFGEMAIVEDNARRQIRAKLENRGRACLFFGNAPKHADDTYRF
jgi:phage gpG-like protein